MSEEDVREGLLDAVANEPPLRFDPDELIATARKQVRRRALVAAGVATVAVAVAAVAVPAALGRGSGTTSVADQPTATHRSSPPTTPTTRPDQWPPPGVEPKYSTVDELQQRGKELSQHLRSSLPTALAPAKDFAFGEFGGEAAGHYYPEQTSVNAAISFTIDGRRYSIVVTSWLPGTSGSPAETCLANCHRLPDQAGGAVYEQTEEVGQGGVIETAFHFRDTGAVVSVAAYNYDMTSGVPPTYHPSLPVPLDQLVAIATDPELEL